MSTVGKSLDINSSHSLQTDVQQEINTGECLELASDTLTDTPNTQSYPSTSIVNFKRSYLDEKSCNSGIKLALVILSSRFTKCSTNFVNTFSGIFSLNLLGYKKAQSAGNLLLLKYLISILLISVSNVTYTHRQQTFDKHGVVCVFYQNHHPLFYFYEF